MDEENSTSTTNENLEGGNSSIPSNPDDYSSESSKTAPQSESTSNDGESSQDTHTYAEDVQFVALVDENGDSVAVFPLSLDGDTIEFQASFVTPNNAAADAVSIYMPIVGVGALLIVVVAFGCLGGIVSRYFWDRFKQ